MKRKLSVIGMFGLAIIVMATACTRSVNNPNTGNNSNNNSGNNSATSNAITSGTWVISSFTEHGENKTSDYTGTDFVFKADGSVTATGNNSGTGSWSMSSTNLNLNFSSGRPLDRLNEPWKIAEATNGQIRLDHPESNEDEHVTFSKK